MNWFISGGCKNGKSHYAQEVAREMAQRQGVPLYYLATMIPHDSEDEARIARHIRERAGMGFDTIERGIDICGCLPLGGQAQSGMLTSSGRPVDPKGVFMLDSVTALLSNEMFRDGGTADLGAPQRVAAELADFAHITGNTVFVSDYIYSDAMIYDDLTEAYRKGLALIDRTLADVCGRVAEVAYGFIRSYKQG